MLSIHHANECHTRYRTQHDSITYLYITSFRIRQHFLQAFFANNRGRINLLCYNHYTITSGAMEGPEFRHKMESRVKK